MTGCAYCKSKTNGLTREHIWPRCIIERTQHELRYSGKARKIVRADLVIKDVCQSCNNGPLSALDNYICALYDQYFAHTIQEGDAITFRYDLNLLSRSLLKIAYNSSRTMGSAFDEIELYASAICAPDVSPVGLYIKLETIYPSQLKHQGGGKSKQLIPIATRCGPILISNRNSDGISARIVQINSYRFYLVVTTDISNRAAAVRYLANSGGTWLKANGEAYVRIPTLSSIDAFQGIQNWKR